jgi:hypothetical protein
MILCFINKTAIVQNNSAINANQYFQMVISLFTFAFIAQAFIYAKDVQ